MLNHQGEFLGGGGRREIGKKKKRGSRIRISPEIRERVTNIRGTESKNYIRFEISTHIEMLFRICFMV